MATRLNPFVLLFHYRLAGWIGQALYAWALVRRFKKFVLFIVKIALVILVAYLVFGSVALEVTWLLISLGFQLAFAMMFMAVQFIGLFWFLSRTKTIETRPGDRGLITFDDYFGSEHLVAFVRQWVSLLTDRRQLDELGGKAISGLLLIGPPGCGKTMLAQALSSDSKAAFMGMGGSDFQAMFFGVGVLKVMSAFRKARAWAKEYGSCITPDTRLLTTDLRWIRAGDVGEGDLLVGIDEYASHSRGKRRLRAALVLAALPDEDDLLTVTTDKGEITVTRDHPFLAHSLRGLRGNLNWVQAADLKEGQVIKFLCPPWVEETGDTWLAGIIDGEGHLRMARNQPTSVAIAQNPGLVADTIPKELSRRGFDTRTSVVGRGFQFYIAGGITETLRLLGTIRPKRLLGKWVSGLQSASGPALPENSWATVHQIRPAGHGPIIRLQTSTRTYIADGFVSHNCILFIDEVDAVASSRGGVQGDPRSGPIQGGMMGGMFGGGGGLGVMSRLLVEMDGIREISLRDQCHNRARSMLGLPLIDPGLVLVLAGTNRPDVLDPAITRPGRFDRKIIVGLPDRTSRRAIINGYLERVKHEDGIDVESLVADTAWASPALLASAIQKDAVRLAIFDGRDRVSQRDIEDALQENALGFQQPISDLDPDQRRQIAVHEASHALAIHKLIPQQHISRVSIVRRSAALGYVMHLSKTDIYARPLSDFTRDIMVSLAGHVGTEIVLGETWTGASGDLEAVRGRVYALAAHGYFGSFPMEGDYLAGEAVHKVVDKFLHDCMEKTGALLQANRRAVDALTEALLREDDLSGEQAVSIMETAMSTQEDSDGALRQAQDEANLPRGEEEEEGR